MPNFLTAEAGLKLGPIVLETFFKHYLERHGDGEGTDAPTTERSKGKKDLLWNEAFQIVKSFLNQSSKHTVEELQEFSNARIPTPPWIFVQRILIPRTMCDEAATYLIQAMGGEAMVSRVVGGTKWWQVRGLNGVDCQWICQKSHLQSRKRHFKKSDHSTHSQSPGDSESIAYMDGTRCMLYAHGGGYYFGSVDQQRYCLQRYARKINGRVLAVNYRLAPQYPFPCGVQDFLAAYLYLIEPPPGAYHAPIPPEYITIGGDSAGGGLCLALLQIIRDTGLPAPSGAVLISPWCDLTHSFPSTIENTATDIIPPYGLCFHKPSVLWPPPPVDITSEVRSDVCEHFRTVVGQTMVLNRVVSQWCSETYREGQSSVSVNNTASQSYEGTTASNSELPPPIKPQSIGMKDAVTGEIQPLAIAGKLPLPWESENSFSVTVNGETVHVDRQIQLYCPNSLLVHPLVSPVLGYLGGLPPLFIIAGEKEVLRDEIIYLAHKAAQPQKYPIHIESQKIYPQNEKPTMTPTFVHLQVYDECCHVLPLFSFTTPAKYCYRAIAEFIKHFAKAEGGFPTESQIPMTPNSPTPSSFASPASTPISSSTSLLSHKTRRHRSLLSLMSVTNKKSTDVSSSKDGTQFHPVRSGAVFTTAGDPLFYSSVKEKLIPGNLICERVSTRGIVRPLNSEAELTILSFPAEHMGFINEAAARRFLSGQSKWKKQFGSLTEKIDSQRRKNISLAKNEITKTLDQFQERLQQDHQDSQNRVNSLNNDSNTWGWSWAVNGERPPASSIVARRDTTEARRLARIADQSVGQEESKLSGNRLWGVLANFLTNNFNDDKDMEDGHEQNARKTSPVFERLAHFRFT